MSGVSRRFVALALAILPFTGSTLQAAVPTDLEAYPLRPPDTSSPRDTLSEFLSSVATGRDAMDNNNPHVLRVARRRATGTLDFSETTRGEFWDEQTARLAYLQEILDRIALPPLEDIPGDAEVAAGDIDSWTLPNTEIVIARVSSGGRAGEYLFSARSVARLESDYRRIQHLPYQPGARGGFLAVLLARGDAAETIDSRIQAELKPVSATSPRLVLAEFLESLNEAFEIVMAADAASLSGREARQADERAGRLIDRAQRMLDLSQVPEALRQDVGTETVLMLKEVLDRAPLPNISSVPGQRTLALTDSDLRWVFPNTELEIAPLPGATGHFGFSAATVDRAAEFYERVQQLPYRGEGEHPGENRFEEDYPNAAVSPGFYDYYIATPGSLVPGASWIGGLVGALPASMNTLFLGQTTWQWLALLLSLLLLLALQTMIYLWVNALGRRTGPARAQWLYLVPPLAGAYLINQYMLFLDNQVNLTGTANQVSLIASTALVYLFVAFATFRVVVALAETLSRTLRSDRSDPEAEEGEGNFDTSLMRVVASSLGFVAALVIFVSGVRELGLDVVPLLAGLGVGGLAIALAVRPTLENMIGGVILYADRPIHVGDFCAFGDQRGVVERIGLRSTRVRALDRTVITVPNSVFADMQLTNFASCDKMLINTVIGLRYETTPEQLRRVLARMRQICFAHPKIESDTLRVRFGAFGASSLDLNVRVYALVADWNEFHAVREDLFIRFMEVIEESGTSVAFPSTTVYLTEDDGLDPEKVAAAEQEVAGWREVDELPFPLTPEPLVQRLTNSLDYPPKGSWQAAHPQSSTDTDQLRETLKEDGTEP